ncbi:MAG: hypothetical protein A3B38_01755 [Candidatus Levybacteria bacterium RIFCSPLOWO2_01_FULL_36_13]|nr:MAG: hypothetical protein A2684_02990 [Candidatus Levybacteria bacterium RIFCSPHIGHO2_01_FULL_36_15b]OGH35589.1 MAG: hypothetical protein A3B38_01755 [Candidatus Levybacteria bacterium RIFCSPLOWO2_01_FULL_36_13]
MSTLKTSLICTVFNEEKTVQQLINSITIQSVIPDEIVFVDGGSFDKTREIIKENIVKLPKLNIKLYVKKGNRSVGRNEAIKKSKGNIILSTDAGCILDKKWVENIVAPFKKKSTGVVAGYYKGQANSSFQRALIPYVLVMRDKVDPNTFLPATRSMAFRKKVWKKVGRFNEKLSHNEDYEFATRLKEHGVKITFEKKAVVYWEPRKSITQALKMFTRFAYGDIEAGLIRNKVIYIFLRYLFAIYLLMLSAIMKSLLLNLILLTLFLSYLLWAINKNYRYIKEKKAFMYLPLLQFTSDIAVLTGSSLAFLKKLRPSQFINFMEKNKSLTALVLSYLILMLAMISWGIPNSSHPFNYFMDEWHQAQSVRNLFTFGSPNIEGSANGSIFHFFLSGLYLIPFIILGIINPVAIKSSVLNLDEQTKLFEILRFNTILFGIASIVVFYFLCKKYFKLNPLVSTFVFVFNPVWLMLSNYFKYDIALMFWTLCSFLFMFRYIKNPTLIDLMFVSIFSSIALSVKLQPIALLVLIIFLFVFYTPNALKKIKWLYASLFLYVIAFLSFGIPDILLGKGSLYEYISSNLIRTPTATISNVVINDNIWKYLITNIYPALFGYILFTISAFYLMYILTKTLLDFIKDKKINISKETFFLFLSFILFALSLIPLKLDASNNRALSLLPFFAIFFGLLFQQIRNLTRRPLLILIVMVLLIIQLTQALSWMLLKFAEDPRQKSSSWLKSNVKIGSTIGIENIPIYQGLPDIVLKEFYLNQYGIKDYKNFNYKIINKQDNNFPKYIVLTNEELKSKHLSRSETREILNRITDLGYKKIAVFVPNFTYLNYFTNDLNYYLSAIVQAPNSISIYEK